ncbi:cell wall-binding repeat-containing protein [uncultured Clostridium sp.]|uniref:cell wall-binding repeat-containing protein n=1 Tax=uncultured Clostridium sp. TaxID=59620 RepID=UPI0025CDD25A|nr:cell wall-binding repeat-containing protein [uncultured Clostridium sp.]
MLISGEQYADAVSASALAKKLGAAILLTTPDTLSPDAKKALDTLKSKNVYIIGGMASISQNIRNDLKDNYTLAELGGTTRYETNAKVADELVKLGVDPSNVMVVGGEGFSDAISVAPVAAAKGQILLLVSNDQSATQPVIDFIRENNSDATIVGTKNVINDYTYDALRGNSRVSGGSTRFDTNLKVLNYFKNDLKSDNKMYIANASPANSDDMFADALVASAVAGKYSAPLVLVDSDNSTATSNAIKYIKDNATTNTDLQLIGGTGIVSQDIEERINDLFMIFYK